MIILRLLLLLFLTNLHLKLLSTQGTGADKLLSTQRVKTAGASPGFGRGGAKKFFFQIWEFTCREATCCAWRSALLGGFGGIPPPRKFFKTVQFGAF